MLISFLLNGIQFWNQVARAACLLLFLSL